MSLLKTNEIQNYNGSSLTLTASTVSTSAQLNTGGNISVTGSLNVSDDSTTRTNLGLGTIATQDSSNVSITGGTIGTSVVFPAGHIIQSESTFTNNYAQFTTSTPALISGFNQNITVKSSNSKMLIFLFLSGAGKGGGNTSLLVDITESTTSLDETLTEISGFTADTTNGFDQTTLFFEHSHSQSAGTSLTYTPKFASAANLSVAFINNYNSADGQAYSYILVQELMV